MSSKRYTDEFKVEAVRQVTDRRSRQTASRSPGSSVQRPLLADFACCPSAASKDRGGPTGPNIPDYGVLKIVTIRTGI